MIVPVALVLAVQVAVVDVVDVIIVRNGDVAAVRAVLVIMVGVGGTAHGELLQYRATMEPPLLWLGGPVGCFDASYTPPHLLRCQYVFIKYWLEAVRASHRITSSGAFPHWR